MKDLENDLENYEIKEKASPLLKVITGIMGLYFTITHTNELINKTLELSFKMHDYMQNHIGSNFNESLKEVYTSLNSLELGIYGTGIVFGGALLYFSLFASEYEIQEKER